MAAAASSAPLDPMLGRAVDFVRPDFHQVNLDVETYLKNERGFKLDSGEPSFPLSHISSPTRHDALHEETTIPLPP